MGRAYITNRKSKVNLLEAIKLAVLNDDCSSLLEDEPSITQALAIIAMCWEARDEYVISLAKALMNSRNDVPSV